MVSPYEAIRVPLAHTATQKAAACYYYYTHCVQASTKNRRQQSGLLLLMMAAQRVERHVLFLSWVLFWWIWAHHTSNVPVELRHSHSVGKNPLSSQEWSRNKKNSWDPLSELMWWVLMIDWSSDLIWADDEAIVSQLTIQLLFLPDTLGEKKSAGAQRIPTHINARRRNRSARRHNALWPLQDVATPPGTPASSMTEVQAWSPRGQAQRFFLPWRPQCPRDVSGQKWGPCRVGEATAVAQPIHLRRGRRRKKQRGEDRWTGSMRGGQKLRSSRSSTFSLRFFAKRAEQKAEVRFLPFQRG